MSNADTLISYRSFTQELNTLQGLQDKVQHQLAINRSDKVYANKLSRKMARYSEIISQVQAKRADLQLDFDRITNTVPNEINRLILVQYYGMAMPDSEIADMMELDVRTVNARRHRSLSTIDGTSGD